MDGRLRASTRQMNRKDHWEHVYSTGTIEKLGWYEPHLQTSLDWIKELSSDADAPIIDVGGGASTLADDLLHAGYRSVTVLDISARALKAIKTRMGKEAELVTWIEGDITSVELPTNHYELWHDRAVFHFLTIPEQQQKYRENLSKALKPDGSLIIGTFALEAPPKCSGLPIQRYSPKRLGDTLGREFVLKRHRKELHITPSGVEQMYLYCHLQKNT